MSAEAHEKRTIGEIAGKKEFEGLEPTNWWVITGGPSSGKTTLLADLSRRGYKTMPEAARVFIDKNLVQGRTINQIRNDEMDFQESVLRMKEDWEEEMPEDELILLDRGLHGDSGAYSLLAGNSEVVEMFPKEIYSVIKRKYKGVFLLDRLPYEQDYARTEDERQVTRVHNLIRGMYGYLGYNVTTVPILPRNERAQFIIDHMRSVDPTVPNLPIPASDPIQFEMPLEI